MPQNLVRGRVSSQKRVGSPCELMAGEVGLVAADTKTGVTTDIEGHWLIATPISYLVFPSIEEAREYAQARVADTPEIEWLVHDCDGYVSAIRALPPTPRRVSRLWAAIRKMTGRSS